jgi:phosphatidylserine/phosphatidylglycerophosphate/cardiolipin synthase-like enzyme
VLQIFLDRWADYVSRLPTGPHKYEDDPLDFLLADKATLRGQNEKPQSPCGKFSVQIARTTAPFPYKFTPGGKGERSVRKLIKHAINNSKRFIYLEDQYLVSMEIAIALSAQLSKLKHLTILVPPSHLEDWASHIKRRTAFIDKLREGGADKVRIFVLTGPSSPLGCNTYVHAKTWIFDDKFAIIGSANCDNRGMAFDSESDAGIYDSSDDQRLTYTLPHRLRMRLWAHHLGLDEAELVDGVASASFWVDRPAGARVTEYTVPDSVRDAKFGKNVLQTLGRWPEDVVLGGAIDPEPSK